MGKELLRQLNQFNHFLVTTSITVTGIKDTWNRFSPLGSSLSTTTDILLDFNQLREYVDYSSENGTYSQWAHTHRNESDHLQTVSEGYSITSIVIFTVPPFLISLYVLFYNFCLVGDDDEHKDSPFLFTGYLLNEFRDVSYKKVSKHKKINLIAALLFVPIDAIVYFMGRNILHPLGAIIVSFKLALTNENYETTRDRITGLKIVELLFETTPQLILGLVFLCNNYLFLSECNLIIPSIPIPTTLVSVVFSVGTLIHGVYTSCKACNSQATA